MYRYETEEEMKMLLQKACKPVQIPQDFKNRLREQLVSNMESKEKPGVRPLWGRPRIMVPIMASITGGLIGYGAWASWNLVPAMLP
jgi:hypothetical protein